ncbi:MAG: DUF445 domain-containing protein [Desulfonatronovibrionaceae bacterium]
MEYLKYILAPVICALIGWFTNYLAVKMLFHPRQPLWILGWNFQGIFPKRQKELARSLGQLVENQLISHHDVQAVISNEKFKERFKNIIDEYVKDLLTNKLVNLHPMVGMFLKGDTLESIIRFISRETEKHMGGILEKVSSELENSLDFQQIVQTRVEQFSMDKLEEILFAIMKKEFRFIEIMGAVLGFVIGVFQSLFLFFI